MGEAESLKMLSLDISSGHLGGLNFPPHTSTYHEMPIHV